MPSISSRITDAFRKPVPPPLVVPDQYDPTDVAAMLREIGIALVEAAQPIQAVEQRLVEIGARYTTEPVQAAVLPTMLFIQIGTATHQMEASAQPSGLLGTASQVDEIAGLAAAGAIAPSDAVAAVRAARKQPPRFGPVLTTLGYAVTTVGFGMSIDPSWKGLPAHLFLGLVVGVIVLIARPFPNLGPILPTLSALVVTLLATWFVADVANDGLLRIISPALIATLPGMALALGAIELADGRIISGASRTVYGLAQMGLLVYGVVLGVRIAGQVQAHTPSTPMGPWASYASIVVIAAGLYFYLSAPRGSLVWLLLTTAVATLAQDLAGLFLDNAHSGFVAAMVAIPFAMLASRIKGAPPSAVLSLAAFWSLVPGQLAFMSLSRKASGDFADTATLSVAGAAIISIALGTLVGWTLVRTFADKPKKSAAALVLAQS
ncbi:MAG: threonine/serine exporter family protein [Mycobacterium sp.]|nr:threonine/serine exporter family protein [Mycobacterium sp.]